MVFFDLLHSMLNILSVGVIHMGTRNSSSLTFQSGVLFHYLGRNDGHWDCFQNFPDTNSSAGKIPVCVLQSVRHVTGGISGHREFATFNFMMSYFQIVLRSDSTMPQVFPICFTFFKGLPYPPTGVVFWPAYPLGRVRLSPVSFSYSHPLTPRIPAGNGHTQLQMGWAES